MRKTCKKVLSLLLALVLCLGLVPMSAFAAEPTSGTCGENVRWALDTNGTLTISGSGEMANYSGTANLPWNSQRSSIKRIVIEQGVTSIGEYAFSMCQGLTNVTIPSNVTSIGETSFAGCKNLTAFQVDSDNQMYSSMDGAVFTKDMKTLVAYPGGKEGQYTIPNGVIGIGPSAFRSCVLTSVIIPDSVTSIGEKAFLFCDGLTSVTIPNSVTSIGANAFDGTQWLENQGEWAIVNGILLEYQGQGGAVTIPSSVTSIGVQAFGSCDSLTSVTIPNSVLSIGDFAFSSCAGLTSVTIGNNVTSIGSSAFSNCTVLTSVIIGNSLTSIGDMAFSGCTGLTNVTIPDSITSIGPFAFADCENLTDVTIGNGIANIEVAVFQNCSALTSVTIPNSVTEIKQQAFNGCAGLTRITIPSNVTSIGYHAFQNCTGLTSVTIPNSVVEIIGAAFSGCTGLKDVYYSGTKAQWENITIWSDNDPLTSANIHYEETDPEPGPSGNADIKSFYPTNGSTFYHDTASIDKAFHITFDREVKGSRPELDFSVGTLEVHKVSDDTVVYQVKESSFTEGSSADVRLYGSSAPYTAVSITGIAPTLDYDTEYYVTMPAGFIKMADGTGSPAVEKEMWKFTTAEVECTALMAKHGHFSFVSDIIDGKDMSYSYDYDESWFFQDSTTYQHDLVKMSIRVALAAFGTDGISCSPKNIEALMRDLEFSNIQSKYPEPAIDSIGCAIGSKNIVSKDGKKIALIMVAVRGGGYYDEWGGNFNLGTGTEHAGFSEAADAVLDRIQKYINKYDNDLQTDKKIWIAGYSRGAATTNLVAKRLDDRAISGISSEDVYAFCFECPQNTTDVKRSSTKYNNIVSIVNPIDLVPKVAMSAWGYGRYGRTYYIPYRTGLVDTKYRNLKTAMTSCYEDLLRPYRTDEIYADKFIPGTVRDNILDSDIIPNLIAHEFVSPDVYYSTIQNDAIKFGVDTFGVASTLPKEKKEEAFISGFLKFLGSEELGELGDSIVGALKDYLFESHYGELCLSWLNSLEGEVSYADPKYRILFVNCPVNVSVYDSSNKLVGQITNNVVQEIENGVVAYIDFNGQKVFALPNSEQYRVELTATDEGTVTYTITEYDLDSSTTEKVISYQEVSIKENNTLVGVVENLDNVSSAKYPLSLNNSTLTPSVTQSGDSVQKFNVEVSRSGNGTVIGGGSYVSGEFAKVTASPGSGETFLGWFVNNILVSSDAEYRFLVDENISITAKFTGKAPTTPDVPVRPSNPGSGTYTPPTYKPNVPQPNNGSVTVTPSNPKRGDTVTITPKPDEDFEVDEITVTGPDGKTVEVRPNPDGTYTFIQPSGAVTIYVTYALLSTELPGVWNNPFTDVTAGDWFYDAVQFVHRWGLMNGYSENRFGPNDNLSRAQLAQILYNKEGKPAVSDNSDFTDVPADQWYTPAVFWANKQGIVGGYGNGLFGPNDDITREQLAVMLWRYAGKPTASGTTLNFNDADKVSFWALDAMRWATENSIINGKGNGILDPKGFATRAEVAQMLKNYLDR